MTEEFNTIQTDINEEIGLYSGSGRLFFEGKSFEGHVLLKGIFLPKSRLVFSFSGLDVQGIVDLMNSQKNRAILEIDEFNFKSEVLITNKNIGGDKPDIEGHVISEEEFSSEIKGEVDTIFFSVFNFPNVWTSENIQKGNNFCMRLTFPDDEYFIVLDAIPHLLKKYKVLKDTMGYLVTHNGFISRKDGKPFLKENVDSILDNLRMTLSFSQGRFIEVNYIKGVQNNRLRYQSVKTYRSWPTKQLLTWFDVMCPDSLYSVFDGFRRLQEDDVWSKSLMQVLGWYYESQYELAMESSIILNQAALERLIWVYFVEYTKKYERKQFENFRFYKRLELMLKEIEHEKISFEPRLELEKFRERNLPTEPWFRSFVQIRNFIQHPDNKHRLEDFDYRPKWDARELGLHLIEVIILFIADFNGKMVNRLDKPHISGKEVEVSWSR